MILATLLLLVGQAPQATEVEPVAVSIAAIIADPEKYDSRRVQLIGYMTAGFEIDRLYFHEGDAKRGIIENSIWLDLDEKRSAAEKLSKRYVVIVGTFRRPRPGGGRPDAGTLEALTRMDVWPPPAQRKSADGGSR